MSSLPGDKGARKPSGLLCSSRTLEHRYIDEMAKPGEKRQWRKLAKRREAKIWKREAKEEMMTAFYEVTDVYTIAGLENIYMDVEDVSLGGDWREELVLSVDDAEELRDQLTAALALFGRE